VELFEEQLIRLFRLVGKPLYINLLTLSKGKIKEKIFHCRR